MSTSANVANAFQSTNTMRMRFTVGNGGDTPAAVPNIFIVPGGGFAAGHTLPNDVVYSGDFPTFAELCDYLEKNKLAITSIKMQTNDTANYSEILTLGTRMPNNRNPREREFQLVDYRTSTGNGYSDSLEINATALGGGVKIDQRTYFKFSNIKKNTYVNILMDVSLWDDVTTLQTLS